MNPELRENIGKAVYKEAARQLDALDVGTVLSWEEALEDTREHYRLCGEKAVEAFIQPLLPNIIPVVNALIAINPAFEKATKELIRAATGKEWETV